MITLKNYEKSAVPFDRPQALRYFGYGGKEIPKEVETTFDKCVKEALALCSYRVCFSVFPVKKTADALDLGFTVTESESLLNNLAGCEKAVVFAATVGIEIDRLITRYQSISPLAAYAVSAIGAERVESLCDVFCGEIAETYKKEGLTSRPRFSCGYGDFPIEKQRDFFLALDCERKIGLTLTSGLLMSPTKSVTALIGLSKVCANAAQGCENCGKSDCEFRKQRR